MNPDSASRFSLRSLFALTAVVAERRAFERERWREYKPGMRICAMWVMGAMLAGGGLASVVRHKGQTTP